MSALTPFTAGASTVNIVVSASSQAVQVQPNTNPSPLSYQVRVFNSGTNITYIAFGTSAVTVTTATGLPIAPNSVEVFTIPLNGLYAAAIGGAAGNTIFFTPGDGN